MLFVKDQEKHAFYGSMQELLKDYPSLIDSQKNGKPYSNKLDNEFRKAGKYSVNGIEIFKGSVKRSPRK